MPGNKYLKQSNGGIAEEAAIQSSAGAGDAGKIPALDSTGRLDSTMMPAGIAADTSLLPATENLSAGDYVNIYDDEGTASCRKADASSAGKEAHGFVLSAVTSGSNATVYHEGPNDQVSGMTAGIVYLSASTPGVGTNTAPSGTGKVVQRLGVAVSATKVNFEPSQPITLA